MVDSPGKAWTDLYNALVAKGYQESVAGEIASLTPFTADIFEVERNIKSRQAELKYFLGYLGYAIDSPRVKEVMKMTTLLEKAQELLRENPNQEMVPTQPATSPVTPCRIPNPYQKTRSGLKPPPMTPELSIKIREKKVDALQRQLFNKTKWANDMDREAVRLTEMATEMLAEAEQYNRRRHELEAETVGIKEKLEEARLQLVDEKIVCALDTGSIAMPDENITAKNDQGIDEQDQLQYTNESAADDKRGALSKDFQSRNPMENNEPTQDQQGLLPRPQQLSFVWRDESQDVVGNPPHLHMSVFPHNQETPHLAPPGPKERQIPPNSSISDFSAANRRKESQHNASPFIDDEAVEIQSHEDTDENNKDSEPEGAEVGEEKEEDVREAPPTKQLDVKTTEDPKVQISVTGSALNESHMDEDDLRDTSEEGSEEEDESTPIARRNERKKQIAARNQRKRKSKEDNV